MQDLCHKTFTLHSLLPVRYCLRARKSEQRMADREDITETIKRQGGGIGNRGDFQDYKPRQPLFDPLTQRPWHQPYAAQGMPQVAPEEKRPKKKVEFTSEKVTAETSFSDLLPQEVPDNLPDAQRAEYARYLGFMN